MITTKNREVSVELGVEFDRYAPEYSSLLNDPLRDRFASDPVFFHRRKWMLIRDFFAQLRSTKESDKNLLDRTIVHVAPDEWWTNEYAQDVIVVRKS